MNTSKLIAIALVPLAAGLLLCGVGAIAQQPRAKQPANSLQLSAADEKAIRDIIKGQETDGWKVVHFHNTTIDEAALKGAAGAPKE
ncbi:MAG: hypothetical protein AB7V46_18990 [Thermomicrobiales bacterium]